MRLAQPLKAGEAGGVRQRKVEQRQVDSLLAGEDVEHLCNRRRLEYLRLGMRKTHRSAQGIAKQRMIVDDQEAGHFACLRCTTKYELALPSGQFPASRLGRAGTLSWSDRPATER